MGFKTQKIVLKMDIHGLKSGSKELWPFGTKKITLSLGSKYDRKTYLNSSKKEISAKTFLRPFLSSRAFP